MHDKSCLQATPYKAKKRYSCPLTRLKNAIAVFKKHNKSFKWLCLRYKHKENLTIISCALLLEYICWAPFSSVWKIGRHSAYPCVAFRNKYMSWKFKEVFFELSSWSEFRTKCVMRICVGQPWLNTLSQNVNAERCTTVCELCSSETHLHIFEESMRSDEEQVKV